MLTFPVSIRTIIRIAITPILFLTLMLHHALAQSGSWSTQLQVTESLNNVKAVTEHIGWVVGAGGTVLRTVDGGASWRSIGDTAMGYCWSIDAIDSSTAWIATTTTEEGGHASIFMTTDGGGKWQEVYSLIEPMAWIDCLKMADPTTGYAVGDPVGGKWVVLKTTNGGTSWARLPNEPLVIGDPIGFLNMLSVISATDVRYATGGDTARIYRTTDGGATWSWNRIPLPHNTYTQALKFNTPLNGVVGSSSRTLARTTDGGLNWTTFTLPGPGTWGLSGYDSLFFAANWHAVQVSTDNGLTWKPSFSTDIGQLLAADFVRSIEHVRGWVLGATSTLSTIASYGQTLTTAPQLNAGEIPQNTELLQNYPNPFNPSTIITYELPAATEVRLSVYDLLGREVATLVEGLRDRGVHHETLDASGLASGAYVCRLQTPSAAVMRKLVLVR